MSRSKKPSKINKLKSKMKKRFNKTGDELLEILESPSKMLVLLFVFLLAIFTLYSYQSYQKEKVSSNNKKFLVLSVNDFRLIQAYQSQVKEIIKEYLEKRAEFDLLGEDKEDHLHKWQTLILKSQEKLLELQVPSHLRDLHLKLVISLSLEKQGIEKYLKATIFSGKEKERLEKEGEQKLSQAIEELRLLLEKHPWLNL